jgi:hypothetical protein
MAPSSVAVLLTLARGAPRAQRRAAGRDAAPEMR